jgi:hypothetical protein
VSSGTIFGAKVGLPVKSGASDVIAITTRQLLGQMATKIGQNIDINSLSS